MKTMIQRWRDRRAKQKEIELRKWCAEQVGCVHGNCFNALASQNLYEWVTGSLPRQAQENQPE